MSLTRKCSRSACALNAVATLTYVYSDRTAVLGPLATYAEPHTYDLCSAHAERLTAPRGWQVVRLSGDFPELEPGHDDLLALADAVREAGPPRPAAGASAAQTAAPAGAQASRQANTPATLPGPPPAGRRGHLRILPDL